MIICPNCKTKLEKVNNSYKCKNNHSFDISKEGYINLLLNKSNAGDNINMIRSRKEFLDKGFFNLLLETIIKEINYLNINNPTILDIGCGDGFYTNSISTKYNDIIGIDISRDAIKYAAKRNKNIIFLVASAKELPISKSSVDIILNIFAPHFIDEILRVLKDDKYLIKVTPNQNHMIEVKEILYEDVYLTNEKFIEDDSLSIIKSNDLNYKINCNNIDIINLFSMTPYVYKTNLQDMEKLSLIKNLDITLDFNISIYQKKHSTS